MSISRATGTVPTTGSSGSGKCTDEVHGPTQAGETREETQEFPDLTDFVNQRTEGEMDKLFANRYTTGDQLYAEIAYGFPDPVVVYPWNKRPKRNFDYTGRQRRSWHDNTREDPGTDRRDGWPSSRCDRYVAYASRRRRNPDMDRDRVCYPGRTDR